MLTQLLLLIINYSNFNYLGSAFFKFYSHLPKKLSTLAFLASRSLNIKRSLVAWPRPVSLEMVKSGFID